MEAFTAGGFRGRATGRDFSLNVFWFEDLAVCGLGCEIEELRVDYAVSHLIFAVRPLPSGRGGKAIFMVDLLISKHKYLEYGFQVEESQVPSVIDSGSA